MKQLCQLANLDEAGCGELDKPALTIVSRTWPLQQKGDNLLFEFRFVSVHCANFTLTTQCPGIAAVKGTLESILEEFYANHAHASFRAAGTRAGGHFADFGTG
jgi:hypothetical protein